MRAPLRTLAIAGAFFLGTAFGWGAEGPSSYMEEREPKRLALVIANGTYDHLDNLGSPKRDGDEIAAKLTEMGFDAVDRYDDVKTYGDFEDLLVAFRKKVQAGDLIIVYFSGHGFSRGQFNYLAPTGLPATVSVSKVAQTAPSAEGIVAFFKSERPGMVLLILDACRSIGNFVLADDAGANVVAKGPTDSPKSLDAPANYIIAFATRPGRTAIGFANDTASIYTNSLARHLGDEGVQFSIAHKDVASEVLLASDSSQEPGLVDWSKSIFFLKPTEEIRAQEKKAWLAALNSKDHYTVKLFVLKHGLSRFAAAALRWLRDNPESTKAATFTLASPIAVEMAWTENLTRRVGVQRPSNPFGFDRTVVYPRPLSAESAGVGVVALGAGIPGSFDLAVLETQRSIVATSALLVRAAPSLAAARIAMLPARTRLQVTEVLDQGDGGIWARGFAASDADEKGFYFPLAPKAPIPPVSFGASLEEVIVPPLRPGLPTLIDEAPIEAAIKRLRERKQTISWVSLSVAVTANEGEAEDRIARLAHAQLVVAAAGISSKQTTSVVGEPTFAGDGVRVRFFGY